MNPDAVVALASSTFKGNSSQEAAILRSSQLTSLQDGVDDQLNERTVPILDALAELCVEDPTEDVVAIGLRFRVQNVELLVATNDVKPKETTLTHIEEIWHLLQEISDRHFSDKREQLQNVNMAEQSPELSFKAGKELVLYNKLFRLVYQYGYRKFSARHIKYFKVFVKFLEATPAKEDFLKLDEDDQSLLSNVAGFIQHFQNISSKIANYHRRNWNVDNREMDTNFTPFLTQMLDEAKGITDDLTGCERLMDIVNVDREF
jgi:hypothetical protein